MMPRRPSPGSIRLWGNVSANSATAAWRCSMIGRRRRALPGTMTYLAGLRGNRVSLTGGSTRSPSSTALAEWQMRVVSRKSAGVSNRSLSSNAARISVLASWLSLGSRQGTRANLAKARLSCSFWLECMPGSSAVMMTRPASMPVMAAYMNASAATFRPTCFMLAKARRPA
jgi:hypothetical protein